MRAKGGAVAAAAAATTAADAVESTVPFTFGHLASGHLSIAAVLNGSCRTEIGNCNGSIGTIYQNVGRMERIVRDAGRFVQMLYALQQLQRQPSNISFVGLSSNIRIILLNDTGQKVASGHEFGNHVEFSVVGVFNGIYQTQNVGHGLLRRCLLCGLQHGHFKGRVRGLVHDFDAVSLPGRSMHAFPDGGVIALKNL